jgi:hypothetical protein
VTSTDTPIAAPDSARQLGLHPPRRRWSRRRTAIALAGLAVLVLTGLLVALVLPTSPSTSVDSPDEATIDQDETNRRSSLVSPRTDSEDHSERTTVERPAAKGKVVSGSLQTQGTGSSSSTAAGPLLVVDSDIYAEPGANGALFLITNAGGAPLTWSVPQEDGIVVVDPESGTIAPGAVQLVSFELPHPLNTDFVYPITVESNGGTAEVNVHLDAFDPVFEIVDGTWNIRNGNTFLVSYTDMDIGLTLKNIGSEPLHVDPQDVDGLAVIGGPWDLAPGAEVHLHLVLCNAMFSGGNPDFHDRQFHIHTDSWQGTLDFMVRFTLAPGQVAPGC